MMLVRLLISKSNKLNNQFYILKVSKTKKYNIHIVDITIFCGYVQWRIKGSLKLYIHIILMYKYSF